MEIALYHIHKYKIRWFKIIKYFNNAIAMLYGKKLILSKKILRLWHIERSTRRSPITANFKKKRSKVIQYQKKIRFDR